MRSLMAAGLAGLIALAGCERELDPDANLTPFLREFDAAQADLAARAPPWSGACPADYLDPPRGVSPAELEREGLASHTVLNAVAQGVPGAVRCAVQRASRDVASVVGTDALAQSLREGAAERLYRYAYFGELLGLSTAGEGRAACDLLDETAREDRRRSVLRTIEQAVRDGHLGRDRLTAAETGVDGGDYCER